MTEGGDNGGGGLNAAQHGQSPQRSVTPGRTLGGRSASPAKRSREDMEGVGGEQQQQQQSRPPGSFTNDQDDGPTDFDEAMAGMSEETGEAGDTQATDTNSFDTSAAGTITNNTSATSLQLEDTFEGPQADKKAQSGQEKAYTVEEIDEQCAHVQRLADRPLDEGDRGVAISNKWLGRVLARSTEGLHNNEYPKDFRAGPVGPLDNSDIVPDGGFQGPFLNDSVGAAFIPLKPGLTHGEDYQFLPYEAFEYICATYGCINTKSIRRYAHNTAPPEAAQTNIQYEAYPPIITVRKVLQPGSEQATKNPTSTQLLRAKKEQSTRGQQSAEDAVKLVSSKAEKFQIFLRRAKEAAGIPLSRKVKIWKLKDPSRTAVDQPDKEPSGVLSPPASRESSPVKPSSIKLVIDQETFAKMDRGVELEDVDSKDQSNNSNYNGSSTMEIAGFFEDVTMLLEEQTGGPGGGEFQSDSKKISSKLLGKKNGSKPGSATASRRTSPAPGGVMTRGRTRKDGRIRGCVGLTNLGNTCYMNSALQCIRSVEELAVFFLNGNFRDEVNYGNPLGHSGKMAEAYFSVLNGIYASNATTSFTPNLFKRTLGTISPMFSGYGQQDSQEFLSFLVDALHEDLNRIQKKPYIENPDSDDKRIHDPQYIIDLGNTYRNNHKQRNDSIAMDLFSGFYKNTMECPECDKVSVTFDPFSLVTVQMPMEVTLEHTVAYLPKRGKPVLHKLDMDKNATVKALKEDIAKKHPGTDANCLWMAEVYTHKLYKVFDDQSTIAEINIQSNDHIFIWELDQPYKNGAKKSYETGFWSKGTADTVPANAMASPMAESFAVPIFSRTKGNYNSHYNNAMHPLYISVTREEAKDYEIILKKVLIAVANITSRPILREFDEDGSQSDRVEDLDADGDRNGSEDSAGISDHSAQSEDGYVNVSIEKQSQDTVMTNGVNSHESQTDKTDVPVNFMDSQYFISPALRNQLFELKFSPSGDTNMHCVNTPYKENTLRLMSERVKKDARRSSIQSCSSEESTTSTTSGDQASPASDSNEGDGIDEKPDIFLGDQPVDESEDELAGSTTIMEPSEVDSGPRGGRNKRNKKRRGGKKGKNRHGVATMGKNRRFGQNRDNGFEHNGKASEDDAGPYYIQLGECIVLDWRPEAHDSLFGGDKEISDDLRGHTYIDENGQRGPVFPDPVQDAKRQKREQRKKHGVNLDDCFDVTRKREVLSQDNAWYCGQCKELRQAAKTLEIWTLPDILVVHLKRFGGNRSFRDKIDLKVDYPIEGLDMSDKVGLKEDGKEYIYDLFAVDNHFGGLGGGHYTAMAKNFHDGEWYDYNDSSCSKISSENRIQSAAAYLLFYRRRSDKPLGPQALQDMVNEYRNPAPTEETDDSSGEGRLGGPIRSPHGSSSVLAGAGVAVTSSQKGPSGNGGQTGAGNSPTTRATPSDQSKAVALYGHQGEQSWGFETLNHRDETDTLLDNVGGDNDSTTAENNDDDDSALDIGGNDMDLSDVNHWDDSVAPNSPATFVNYSAGAGGYDDNLYDDDPDGDHRVDDEPVADIYLDNPPAKSD